MPRTNKYISISLLIFYMKKWLFVCALCTAFAQSAFAQYETATGNTDDKSDIVIPDAPLLNAMQLDRELTYYTIEEAVANPEKVYKLVLRGKKLKSIPKEVFYLTNLQSLDLSENCIQEIPAEIGNLTRLQTLNFYKNKIKVMPPEMQELANLQALYIADNRLIEIPAWVGGMGKLRYFNFAYNRITRLEAEKVANALYKTEVDHGFKK